MSKATNTAPVTVIITVLNEAASIGDLIRALASQTLQPEEIIVVDGASTDTTYSTLKKLQKDTSVSLRIIKKAGNRSVGRNAAIDAARTEWIAITDAGCIPRKEWLAELVKCQKHSKAKVAAGYYTAEPQTPFEEAVVPYALVMPDRVDETTFLPATRSMLLQKAVWEQLDGFNESLSDNEDFAFANKLRQQGVDIAFARNAVVVWQPRSTLKEFVTMIYRFARGDARAGIIRPKVLVIFLRYLIAGWIFLAAIQSSSMVMFVTLLLGGSTYILWAIEKNYRYVKRGWYWLPVLQITSDLAVMAGSLSGIWLALKFF